jgi:hypothetical protein
MNKEILERIETYVRICMIYLMIITGILTLLFFNYLSYVFQQIAEI